MLDVSARCTSPLAKIGDPPKISDRTNATVRGAAAIFGVRLVKKKQEEILAEPSLNVVKCRTL
jgi:hypothetical protein